jgi:single-strand DNA-binding protein
MSSKVTLQGRLTRDPELRFTQGGTAVAQFAVVTVRRVKNASSGEWEDQDVSFWDCTAFGPMAENIVESMEKGTSVIVTGNMRQESWTTKDQEKRTSWRVNVDDVGVSVRWKAIGDAAKSGTSLREPVKTGGGFNSDPPF